MGNKRLPPLLMVQVRQDLARDAEFHHRDVGLQLERQLSQRSPGQLNSPASMRPQGLLTLACACR